MLAGDGRDLVGDGQDRVESFGPGDVEVVLQLLGLERVAAGLNFNEACPRLRSASDADEPVWVEPLLTEHEGDLDIGADRTGWRAERLKERPAILAHRAQHRQERRRGPTFLLL